MEIAYDNNVLEALSKKKCKSISEMFNGCDEEGVDLLRKLLVYNPEKRLSVEEILSHSYFK